MFCWQKAGIPQWLRFVSFSCVAPYSSAAMLAWNVPSWQQSQLEWKHTDTITRRCPAVHRNTHGSHRLTCNHAQALTCDSSPRTRNSLLFCKHWTKDCVSLLSLSRSSVAALKPFTWEAAMQILGNKKIRANLGTAMENNNNWHNVCQYRLNGL